MCFGAEDSCSLLHGFGAQHAHDFFVDGEDDAAGEDEASETRGGAAPEGEDALFAESDGCAVEGVCVFGASFECLHSGFDDAVVAKGTRRGGRRGKRGRSVWTWIV